MPTQTGTPAVIQAPAEAEAIGEFFRKAVEDRIAGTPLDPAELTEEIEKYYAECSFNATYAQFHDCRCLAMQYLDTRIAKGPEASEGEIVTEISGLCVNQAGVASYYYTHCPEQFAASVATTEEFCTCYANTMAKSYAEEPSLYRYHLRDLTLAANKVCQ